MMTNQCGSDQIPDHSTLVFAYIKCPVLYKATDVLTAMPSCMHIEEELCCLLNYLSGLSLVFWCLHLVK